eukprot:Seg1422.10 transcript_id=Seg1422.10/GoldUCD/mRNA.D3Y31 product="Homeobox protein Nkx-2.4" protein_id=Seg1422.10/GoldUCD/D3Y31
MSFFIKDILGDTINDRKAVNTTSKDTIAKDPSIQHGYKRLRNSEQASESKAQSSHQIADHDTELDQFGKKRRILFTRQQTWELERAFRYQPYLSSPERELLARRIHLSPNQIKIWFQNHRYKLKKYVKDIIQQAEFEHERQSLAEYRKFLRPNTECCQMCTTTEQRRFSSSQYERRHSLDHLPRQNRHSYPCPCSDNVNHYQASCYSSAGCGCLHRP